MLFSRSVWCGCAWTSEALDWDEPERLPGRSTLYVQALIFHSITCHFEWWSSWWWITSFQFFCSLGSLLLCSCVILDVYHAKYDELIRSLLLFSVTRHHKSTQRIRGVGQRILLHQSRDLRQHGLQQQVQLLFLFCYIIKALIDDLISEPDTKHHPLLSNEMLMQLI